MQLSARNRDGGDHVAVAAWVFDAVGIRTVASWDVKRGGGAADLASTLYTGASCVTCTAVFVV